MKQYQMLSELVLHVKGDILKVRGELRQTAKLNSKKWINCKTHAFLPISKSNEFKKRGTQLWKNNLNNAPNAAARKLAKENKRDTRLSCQTTNFLRWDHQSSTTSAHNAATCWKATWINRLGSKSSSPYIFLKSA